MTFEDQLNALILFHLEDHTSGRELIQTLQEDAYAREHIERWSMYPRQDRAGLKW